MRVTIRVAIAATAAAAVLALSACSDDEPKRDSQGNVTEPATAADVFDLRRGDCTGQTEDPSKVTTIDIVPCDEAHDQEVFAIIQIPGADFPGDQALQAQAKKDCAAEFETFVGKAWQESELDFSWLQPTEQSWGQNDRALVCLVIDPAGPVTGTLKGAGR